MNDALSRAYQAYLDAKHARFATAEEVVFRVVREATGKVPATRARIVKGGDNEVHLVGTACGDEVLVRIRRDGELSSAGEAAALEAARAAGVPVPRVLRVGRLPDAEALEYMVQTRVRGRPLADVHQALGPAARERALRELGQALARLHSVRQDPARRPPPADVPRAALLTGGLAPDEADAALALIATHESWLRAEAPVLCHGDPLPEHVFVDADGRLQGLIDFGMSRADDPAHDLALVRMWWGPAAFELVAQGHAGPREGLGRRLQLHTVLIHAGALAHCAQVRGHPDTGFHLAGLRGALRATGAQARPY